MAAVATAHSTSNAVFIDHSGLGFKGVLYGAATGVPKDMDVSYP
jgi:hypothetical protein